MTLPGGPTLRSVPAEVDSLPAGVQAWFLDLSDAERWQRWAAPQLCKAESTRFARLLPAGATARRILCRAVLRSLLARELAIAPRQVELVEGAHGKPALGARHGASALSFNLSHSAQGALFALSRRGPVGVDLEAVDGRRDLLAMARLAFTPSEAAELQELVGAQRSARFYAIWCAKEATMKADGRGLAMGLASFRVHALGSRPLLGPAAEAAATSREGDGVWRRWQLWTLAAPDGYAGTLCLPTDLPNGADSNARKASC